MEEEYRAHPGVNHSTLKYFARGAAHANLVQKKKVKETDAMRLGTLVHLMVLEPHLVEEQVAVTPEVNRRTKAGKEELAKFRDQNKGRMTYTADEYAQAEAMAESARSHPAAKALLDDLAYAEVERYWRDDVFGIECKCKIDGVTTGRRMLDVKTTIDASPSAFSRAIFNNYYHTQAAWYMFGNGVSQGPPAESYSIIAIEKTEPFDVVVYDLSKQSVDLGMKQVMEWLRDYHYAKKNDTWVSHPKEVLVEPPPWLLSKEQL